MSCKKCRKLKEMNAARMAEIRIMKKEGITPLSKEWYERLMEAVKRVK